MDDLKYVRKILHYDPDTGDLIWINKTNEYNRHNTIGEIAGWKDNKGYIRLFVNRKKYMSHRIIWFYMTGEWPKDQIDHINGVKDDNRWCNLREATNGQNQANTKQKTTKRSKYKGVYPNSTSNTWWSSIGINGKSRYLGTFLTQEKAALAYNKAALMYHGNYAALNEIKDD